VSSSEKSNSSEDDAPRISDSVGSILVKNYRNFDLGSWKSRAMPKEKQRDYGFSVL